MAKKRVAFNPSGIDELPDDQSVVYQIQTEKGQKNYIGSAQKGRVRDQIKGHLGEIPGAKVTIAQHRSIADARESESEAIKRHMPKYNKKGKR